MCESCLGIVLELLNVRMSSHQNKYQKFRIPSHGLNTLIRHLCKMSFVFETDLSNLHSTKRWSAYSCQKIPMEGRRYNQIFQNHILLVLQAGVTFLTCLVKWNALSEAPAENVKTLILRLRQIVFVDITKTKKLVFHRFRRSKCHFLAPENRHFWQKWPFSNAKKWHFERPNQSTDSKKPRETPPKIIGGSIQYEK